MAAPYYLLLYKIHWPTIAMDLGYRSRPAAGHLLFYAKVLLDQLGWTIFPLALLGALVSRRWSSSTGSRVMASWMFSCWLTLTLIGHKEARHVIYSLPPAIYFAAGLLLRYFRTPRLRPVAVAAAVCLAAIGLVAAWRYQRP
jgi:hypothetical protein